MGAMSGKMGAMSGKMGAMSGKVVTIVHDLSPAK